MRRSEDADVIVSVLDVVVRLLTIFRCASCAVAYPTAHAAHRKIVSNRTTSSKTDTVMSTSSLVFFNAQLVDDILGAGFMRVSNRSLGGHLIFYRPSERYHSIPDRDANPLAVDKGT